MSEGRRTLRGRLEAKVVACAALAVAAGCGGAGGPSSPPPRSTPASLPSPASVPSAAPEAGEADAAVPVEARNPVWGSRTALVTIVEFADFQCPFCARSEPALERVREAYGPEVVRLVWKNLPLSFHAHARPAAEAAMGVFALGGNDAFWRFHRAAFAPGAELEAASLEQWAKDAGVGDMAAWRAGASGHAWGASVDADLAEAQALGVEGTPTFFVNGVEVVGQQSFEELKALVDDQVKAAEAKIAAGTPRDRVYSELARENRASAPKAAEDAEPEEDTKTVFKVPVGKSPARGSTKALVTIVEFGDYQCPYCARAEETLAALRQKYGDVLRVVFKNEPLEFHPRAEPAAQAALEVREEKGDAAFWSMHDELFAHQQALGDDDLVAAAVKLGARADKVKAAIAGHTHADGIDADVDVGDDFQVEGTPHFFINGRRLVGAQPQDKFEAIIDEELKHAHALLAAGTAPGSLYEAELRGGKDPEPPEQRTAPSMPAADPARGAAAATARVTVHEWADFECPFCARVEPTLKRLLDAYRGKVRIVWHDLPLPMHADARTAAQAAREALRQKGEGGFWSMHDTLFQHQDELDRKGLDGFGAAMHLDMGAWQSALDQDKHAQEIGSDESAADAMHISGTPAFLFVPRGAASGYFLSGAQPYEKFRKLVERSLGEAK